jgi:hypothetical protein
MTRVTHEQWFAPDGAMQEVTGFLTPRAAAAISAILTYQKAAALHGSLAEIGVHYGKTLIGLALAANPGERVVGLDLFPGDTKPKVVDVLRSVLPGDYGGEVVLSTADSTGLATAEWISKLARPARFVHVDGDHTYRSVLSDLLLADSHLLDGGVVVIDDFLHEWYPDVTEGVFDALRVARNIRPVAVIPRMSELLKGGTKLVCCTPSAVEAYADLLRATFPQTQFRSTPIAGHPAFSMFTSA